MDALILGLDDEQRAAVLDALRRVEADRAERSRPPLRLVNNREDARP